MKIEIKGLTERLREARSYMPRRILAEKIGKSEWTIVNWESGKHNPSLADIQAVARATGCNVHWLMSGQGKPFINNKKSEEIQSHTFADNSRNFYGMYTALCEFLADVNIITSMEPTAIEIEKLNRIFLPGNISPDKQFYIDILALLRRIEEKDGKAEPDKNGFRDTLLIRLQGKEKKEK